MRIALLTAALLVSTVLPAFAYVPSVADLDAASRASGNRKDVALAVGKQIFQTEWPATIFRVEANAMGDHLVIGIALWGVKFHHPISREQFVDEVQSVVSRALSAAPQAEEVDVWAVVPINVGKGIIVSGDLARPTTRTVYTVSVQRNSAADLGHLLAGPDVYWDEEWARHVFKKAQ